MSKQRKKILKSIPEMRMIDDTFMSAVFDGQLEETSVLLRIVLGKEDIEAISSNAQVFLSNIHGREIKLDILARDNAGKVYNVEVQRDMARASVKRVRFHAAMVDGRLLEKNQDFDTIPDRYTIFITEDDKYKMGLPAYHAQNRIEELDNEPLNDGAYIIYVNGQYRNTETPIGRLMHDFFCAKADDILNDKLRERVRYLKDTEGGRQKVYAIVENLITEEKIELAKKAIARGKHSLAEIAEDFELPLPFVEELARQKSA